VDQQGKEHILLRNTLDDLRDTGISLMPVGFEKDLSVADVADLFSYVKAQGRVEPASDSKPSGEHSAPPK
jgi:hypothetical protein